MLDGFPNWKKCTFVDSEKEIQFCVMEDNDVPPTDFCLRLRPWLSLVSSLSLGLSMLRLPTQPAASLFSFSIFVIGMQASWKTLRMHLVSVFFFAVCLAALVDCLTFLKEVPFVQLKLQHPHWFVVAEAISVIAAPIVSLAGFTVSLAMLRDYSATIDARAAEEQRVFRARFTETGYGGFVAFSGRGHTLVE